MAQFVLTDKPLGSGSQVAPALRSAGIVVAATALIAVCAYISLPLFFTPVPLTLQPFAVLLVGLLLSPGAAFAALALYLLEGVAGLPVFTPHGPGGILQLLGPTGGYLFSYPLAAPLVSWLNAWSARRGTSPEGHASRRFYGATFVRAAWSAAVGNVVILMLGAVWLFALTHVAMETLLVQAVLPFLPGDALKVVAAAVVATGAGSLRARKASVPPAS